MQCRKCNEWKQSSDFFPSWLRGHYSVICKTCAAERKRAAVGRMHGPIPPYKTCSRCKLTKPREGFYNSKTTKDGLQYHCRECSAAYGREYGRDCYNEIKRIRRREAAVLALQHLAASERVRPTEGEPQAALGMSPVLCSRGA